jgi:aryl-alcohol dehydrogenase-like predicted oxidoreductase
MAYLPLMRARPGHGAVVRALASTRDATPGQVALAWLLAQQPSIVPAPGTRSIQRIDERG